MRKLLFIFMMLFGLGASAQFNSSKHTTSNKPFAASGKPTDARSFYYDAATFSYRPYASRAEILSYLSTSASRTGNFPIFMDSAGVRYELWFRSGTTNADLQLKDAGTAGNTTLATTIADLKTKTPSTSYAVTMGTNTAGDGGGKEYFWDAFNNTAADGISVIIPDGWEGTGRWVEQKKIYKVHARQLGLYGDNRTTEAAAIKSAFTLATSKGWEIDLTGMTLNLNGDSIVLSNQLNLTSSNKATSIIRNAKFIIPKGGMVSKYITFKDFTNTVIGFTGKIGSLHYPNGGKLTLDIQDNDFIENYQDVAELTPAATSDTSGTVAMLYHSVFARNNFIKSKYASFHADVQYDGLVLEGNTWEGTGDSAVYNFTLHIGLDGANNVFKQRGLRASKNYFRNIIHNQDPTGTFYGVLLSGKGMIYDGNVHDNFSAPVYLRGDDIQIISPQFLNSVQFCKYALIIKDGNPEGSLKIINPLIKGYYGTGIYVDSRFRNISITTPDITLDPFGSYVGDAGIRIIAGSALMELLSIKGGTITNNQTNSGTYAVMVSSSGYIRDVDVDGTAISSLAGGISIKLINSAGKVTIQNSPSFKFATTSAFGANVVDVFNNKWKYSSGIVNLYTKKTAFIRDNQANPDSAFVSVSSRLFNVEADASTNSADYYLSDNKSDFTRLVNFLRLEDSVGTVYVSGDKVLNGVNGTTSAYIHSTTNGPAIFRVEMDNFKNPFNAMAISSSTANQRIRVFIKNGSLARQSPYSFTGTNQLYDTSWIENVDMPWEPIIDNNFTVKRNIQYTSKDSIVSFYGPHFKIVDGAVRLQDSVIGGGATVTSGIEWYVDAVGGNDSNDGKSAATAFKTITKLKASGIQRGDRVYLARGSEWREELRANTIPQVHFADFGYGDMPTLNGSDIIPNQSLKKYPGYTNLYYIVHTNEYTGALSEHMVWEDDKFLKRAVSKADADTVTNGAFYTVSNPTPGATDTIWIKPSGTISPYNNGKEYEVSKRAYGLFTGDSSTAVNIRTKYSGANNGSLVGGTAVLFLNCESEYGGKHNVFIGSGYCIGVYANKGEQRGTYGGTTPFVAFRSSGAGHSAYFIGCKVTGGDGITRKITGNEVGIYAHTASDSDPFDLLVIQDCILEGVQEAINVGAKKNIVRNNTITYSQNQLVIRNNVDTVYVEDNKFLGLASSYVYGSTALVNGGVADAVIYLKNNVGNLHRATVSAFRVSGEIYSDNNSIVYRDKAGGSYRGLQVDAGSLKSFKHNVIDSAVSNLYLASGVTVAAGAIDSNVYKGGGFRYSGTDYTDFAAYRAAVPTQDVNSVSDAPGWYGDPRTDFTFTTGGNADLLKAGYYSTTAVEIPSPRFYLTDTSRFAPIWSKAILKDGTMWVKGMRHWEKAFANDNKTYSSGITDASDVVTNDLITGKAGGQTITGGTASGNSLTLSSTSHATKGKILFGTSSYDEANNYLGIRTQSPQHPLHLGYGGQLAIYGTVDETTNYGRFRMYSNTSNVISYDLEKAGTGPSTGYHAFKINGSAVMDLGTVNTSFYNNILPNSNNTRDIGRNDLRWKNLFLSGNVGIGGSSAPTARLQIAAGTGAPNTASLILDGGTLLAAPVNGAIENNGTHLYVTLGGVRYQLDQQAPSTRQLVKVSDTDYTIATGTGDITVVFWTMTATHTCYLPSASTNTGRRITVKHGGDGAFDITLSPAVKSNSSTSTATVGQGSAIMFESDGTDWIKVY